MAFYLRIFIFEVLTYLLVVKASSECGCPDVWTAFQGSCYLFGHGQALSFIEAEHYCRQHGAHLVHVDNAAENGFLKDFMTRLAPKDYYWIGLTDELIEGSWRWYDTDKGAEYTDWGPGEPNGYQKEDCVTMVRSYGYRWIDVLCNHTNVMPACERSEVGGQTIIG